MIYSTVVVIFVCAFVATRADVAHPADWVELVDHSHDHPALTDGIVVGSVDVGRRSERTIMPSSPASQNTNLRGNKPEGIVMLAPPEEVVEKLTQPPLPVEEALQPVEEAHQPVEEAASKKIAPAEVVEAPVLESEVEEFAAEAANVVDTPEMHPHLAESKSEELTKEEEAIVAEVMADMPVAELEEQPATPSPSTLSSYELEKMVSKKQRTIDALEKKLLELSATRQYEEAVAVNNKLKEEKLAQSKLRLELWAQSTYVESAKTHARASENKCRKKILARKDALKEGIDAATDIVRKFLDEAKNAGVRETTIQFYSFFIPANTVYDPSQNDHSGCAMGGEDEVSKSSAKAGAKGKTLYRIGASLLTGTTSSSGCFLDDASQLGPCLVIGENCALATKVRKESGLLSEADHDKLAKFQSSFTDKDVTKATQTISTKEALVYLAWEFLEQGYSVQINEKLKALDFYLWKPVDPLEGVTLPAPKGASTDSDGAGKGKGNGDDDNGKSSYDKKEAKAKEREEKLAAKTERLHAASVEFISSHIPCTLL